MKQQIKMIGLDLDGTLLTTKKELLPYTKKVLEEAIAHGVIVLIVTGRSLTGIPEELMTFPGIRYAVTSNGARILDLKSENVFLYEAFLPLEKAFEVLELFKRYDTLQEIVFDGQGYVKRELLEKLPHYVTNPIIAEYIAKMWKPVEDIYEVMEQFHRPMDKVQALFSDRNERLKALRELEMVDGISVVSSGDINVEINASGVNKGYALIHLGKILGIKREEIMTFGDSNNDIEMIREAGFGVAMKNADHAVKEVADYITGTNDDQGVAKAIEQFVLR